MKIPPTSSLSLLQKTPRLRLALFAVMFVAVLMLGARVVDITQLMAEQDTGEHDAKPEASKEAPKEAAAKADAKAEPAKAEAKPEAKSDAKPDAKAETKPAAAAAAPAPEAAPAVEEPALEPENYTEAEVSILKRLSERRQELDKRGRELDQREALLKVTEQRVDKKIGDLKGMQEQIRKVLGDASEEQKVQESSMIKIYETMKPKDAAKIFENLELPILMNVVSRMKETKVAPVLAAMNPVKAKEVTTALMQKKPLPAPP